jgi:hypothetical protein
MVEVVRAVRQKNGGAKRDRTADLLHAMQALSQLSYGPIKWTCIWRKPGKFVQVPCANGRNLVKSVLRRKRKILHAALNFETIAVRPTQSASDSAMDEP